MPTADANHHEGRPGRSRRLPLWAGWLLASVTLALLYPPTMELIPSDGLYLAVGIAAVVGTLVGIRRHRPEPATVWWVMAGGLALTVLGDAVYGAVMVVTGDEPPFPGPPDLLYVPGLTAITAAGVLLAWQRHRTATTRSLIDAGLVSVTAIALLWLTIGAETVRADGADAPTILVGLTYPMLDALLVGVLAALLLGGQQRSTAVRLLIGAFALQFVADTLYLTQAVDGLYAAGGLLDVAWLVTYAMIAAAALHPSMAAGASPLPVRLTELRGRHVIGLAVPVVLAAAALLQVAHTSAADDPQRFVLDLSVLVPMGVVVTVLLVWRVANVSNELARTARERDAGLLRELIATDVVSRLARADTVVAIQDALAHGVDLLPGSDRSLTLQRGSESLPRQTVWSHEASEDTRLVAVTEAPLLADHLRSLERVASDVSMALDRCRLAEELRSSERRFRSLVRNAPDAITVHDVDGTLTYVSPALGQIVGMSEEALLGRRWDELVHTDHVDEVRDAHLALVDHPTTTSVIELRLRHHDGSWRWVETRLTNLVHDPSVRGIVANHRDITERQRLQRELQHQATHDPLTGVANRRRFADEVRDLGPERTDAIVFLDLDHFKSINDRLGHAAGDLVLAEVAARLAATVRPTDLVARLGGDEFAVLLRATTVNAAHSTADRLLAAVREPMRIGQERVDMTASVGVAVAGEGSPGGDLLHEADLAMYQAKSAGRGRVEQATPQVRALTAQRLALDADLRAALTDGGLSLCHRPVVDLATGVTVGSQTELRWLHPTRGEVPAAEFLLAAERMGVEEALASWAFHEACWSVAGWVDEMPGVTIAVDLPGAALRTPGLADRFDAALRAAGLPGHHIVLQIAGVFLLDRTPAADRNLEKLRHAGVRVRASNLATSTPMRVVRDAPIDELSLAGEFVAGLANGPEEAALARAVLLLADSFGIEVVAEGVATEAQRSALVERGAVRGTGPLFGGPTGPEDLARTFASERPTLPARRVSSVVEQPPCKR